MCVFYIYRVDECKELYSILPSSVNILPEMSFTNSKGISGSDSIQFPVENKNRSSVKDEEKQKQTKQETRRHAKGSKTSGVREQNSGRHAPMSLFVLLAEKRWPTWDLIR